MRWCRDGELAGLFKRAGLGAVRSAPLRVHAGYADFEDLWAPFLAGVGPSGAFAAALGENARGALHDAYRRRLGAGDEPFELTARAWAVAGTVL
jgi:hypothetical protein